MSVDLHQFTTIETEEKAIAGVTKGIMKLNDCVTWRAKYFGVYQKHTTKITSLDYPNYFVSEMISGSFRKMYHQHLFSIKGVETIIFDIFEFEAPFGALGKIFSKFVLIDYMRNLLTQRNIVIKNVAEGNGWRMLLNNATY